MKLVFGLFVLVVIAASIFADYKWKRWMAARKLERESGREHDPTLRS